MAAMTATAAAGQKLMQRSTCLGIASAKVGHSHWMLHGLHRPRAGSTYLSYGARCSFHTTRPAWKATHTTPKPSTFYVPTIDIGHFLADPHSEASARTLEDVRAACMSTGFFQITGHGIPTELQQDIFKAAARFFALPSDEKNRLDASKTIGHRGYDVLASQSYEEGVLPDLKEGFYVGTDVPSSHPMHGRFYMGPNQWPPDSALSRSQFQAPCEQYYHELHDLSLKVLSLVGATLSVSESKGYAGTDIPSVFHQLGYLDPIPACPLRLLHYPPARQGGAATADQPQYGASAHTDFGAITLLLQDENPGLEVLDTTIIDPTKARSGNVWRPIQPTPGAYVVNIGDMISRVTGGVYKSSVHRVVCKKPESDRYSIVFFLDGCLDAELKPVEDSAVLQGLHKDSELVAPLTVEQHMIERLTMSYGKGKKDARRDG